MKSNHIPHKIMLIGLCLSLISCQSGVRQILGNPSDMAPDQEIKEDIIEEFGSVDPAVNQLLETLMEEGGVPSSTVGIVVENELVWAKSYNGIAGTDTVYIIGSVTKSFTATAILQLYERGLIDLDSDINEYLPFPVRHPEYPDRPISVRTLLTNQSGLAMDVEEYRLFQNQDTMIAEYVNHMFGINLPELNLKVYPTKAEFYKALLTPGEEYYSNAVWSEMPGSYQYSNIGYGLLAYIIEHVSGLPLEDYFEINIFEPLEMTHSGAKLAGLEPYHAYPYQRIQGDYITIPLRGNFIKRFCSTWDLRCIWKNLFSPGGYIPVPDDIDQYLEQGYLRFPLYENLVGSGGLRTSVLDLSKFMIAHMNDGLAPNGHQLLLPETIDMMHEISVPVGGSINMIPMVGYGYGWTICEDGIEGHIGGASGYEAEMLIKESLKGKVGIIFLRNWTWELADDYENGFEYWKKYHVGVREVLLEEAMHLIE